MARLNLVLAWPGLVLIICAAGCSRGEDLSPDGKTVVFTYDHSVVFHDFGSKRKDIELERDGVGSPKFSPDGNWVAVAQTAQREKAPRGKVGRLLSPLQTLIIGRDGHIEFSVPQVAGPFAWKPDGTEFVGVNDRTAKVVHVKSRQVVLTYPLPGVPTSAAWLGEGGDLAFGNQKQLTVIRDGVAKTRALVGDLGAIGFDKGHTRVVWSETFDQTGANHFPDGKISILASDLDFKNIVTLVPPKSGLELMGSGNRMVLPISLEVSPDGSKVAVAGLADSSAPGLLKKYVALGGFRQRNSSNNLLESRLKRIEKQLKFQAVCSVTSLDGKASTSVKRLAIPCNSILISAHWISGGENLAVLVDDKVYPVE